MKRRAFVASVVVSVIFPLCLMVGRQATAVQGPDFVERARRIHAEMIGVDSHIDTLQRVLNGKEDISQRTGKGHVDLPRLREAGVRPPSSHSTSRHTTRARKLCVAHSSSAMPCSQFLTRIQIRSSSH
jgi:hypothetical protein